MELAFPIVYTCKLSQCQLWLLFLC